MTTFAEFIDGVADHGQLLAKEELKQLIAEAKQDKSDFVRLQAENLERWTLMLAAGDLTAKGYKMLVSKMEVLSQLQVIKLKVNAKASAQRLAEGIQRLVIDALFTLI